MLCDSCSGKEIVVSFLQKKKNVFKFNLEGNYLFHFKTKVTVCNYDFSSKMKPQFLITTLVKK